MRLISCPIIAFSYSGVGAFRNAMDRLSERDFTDLDKTREPKGKAAACDLCGYANII